MSRLEAVAQHGLDPPDFIVSAGGGEIEDPTEEAPEHRLRAIMASLGQTPWDSADFRDETGNRRPTVTSDFFRQSPLNSALCHARPRLHLASPAEFMATLLACVEIDEIHEYKYGSSRKENMTFTPACKLF